MLCNNNIIARWLLLPCFNICSTFDKILCYFYEAIGTGKVKWCVTIFVSALHCIRTELLRLSDNAAVMLHMRYDSYNYDWYRLH